MKMWRALLVVTLAHMAHPFPHALAQEVSLPAQAPVPYVRQGVKEAPPLPAPRPTSQPAEAEGAADAADDDDGGKPSLDREADPRSDVAATLLMPRPEILCRQALRATGANFAERQPPAQEGGCALPYPVELRSLPGGTKLEPEAVVNCATALALAQFADDVMTPIAAEVFSQRISGIGQASGYVCRPRNGSIKLSEHAFGNAVDIASFKLADGSTIGVAPDLQGDALTFMERVRTAACGPFRTVLGPGSDADHANHLHLDLSPRSSRDPICE